MALGVKDVCEKKWNLDGAPSVFAVDRLPDVDVPSVQSISVVP